MSVVTSVDKDLEESESSQVAGGNVNGAATLETVWKFLRGLNIELPDEPAIPFLEMYPENLKGVFKKILSTNIHGNIIHIRPKVKTTQKPVN